MRMPVDTLLSNWASMVMTALAWTLKAWFALRLPETGRWATRYAAEKAAVTRMEFKTFVQAFMLMPVHVVRASRRLVFRLLVNAVLFAILAAVALHHGALHWNPSARLVRRDTRSDFLSSPSTRPLSTLRLFLIGLKMTLLSLY